MRSVFFVLAASFFAHSASAASPSDHISSTHFPSYATHTNIAGFTIIVGIVVKKAYVDDEDLGSADFTISVEFPVVRGGNGGQVVAMECPDEAFLFEEGAMLFAPFEDDVVSRCTVEFIRQMNAAFVANGAAQGPVVAPIALPYDPEANTLEFSAISRVKIVIPAGEPVPKREARVL